MLNIAVKEIQQTAGQTAVVLHNVCDCSVGLTAGFAGQKVSIILYYFLLFPVGWELWLQITGA